MMTPEQFAQVQQVFLQVRELTPDERDARLADEDASVRREVSSLLEAEKQCDGFLEYDDAPTSSLPISNDDSTLARNALATTPERIGEYRLLQQIGEGGHGSVFMAEQQEPIYRKVAVKLIKPGMDSKQVLARFQAERQALALMDHPSIARVIDGGSTETGAPYFVMELVKGVQIDDFCETNRLALRERLQLFLQVCRAVHHAHQKGVIHRDLKPSNVLVTMGEDEPIAKVIDFGIAKALDAKLTSDTLFTGYGQMIGTLQYMSPEQAEMSAVDIDTRSDVYSLGVLLYQLLTGQTPISREELLAKGMFEVPRIIRETEPATPSSRITSRYQLRTQVDRSEPARGILNLQRGDLDWIAMKALAKDRRRRYDSALDFARDIERYLAGDPVEAHPPTLWYKTCKFAQRYWVSVSVAAIVVVSLVTGIAGLGTGLNRASVALKKAELERTAAISAKRELAENMYSELVQSAWRAAGSHDHDRARDLLEKCLPELREWEWRFVQSQIQSPNHDVIRPAGGALISSVSRSANHPWVACVLEDGQVELWDSQRKLKLRNLESDLQANVARFSHDGRFVIIGYSKGQIAVVEVDGPDRTPPQRLGLGGIYDIAVATDKPYAAVCTGGSWVRVFNTNTLETIEEWKLTTRVSNLEFTNNDRRIVATGFNGKAYILALGDEVTSEFLAQTALHGIARMPDESVAILTAGKAIRLPLDQELEPTELVRCPGLTSAIAVSENGTVVVGCGDGKLFVKTPSDESRMLADFGSAITAISATEDNDQFLVAFSDGRLIELGIAQAVNHQPSLNEFKIANGVFLPQSQQIILFDGDGWMRTFDLSTRTFQSEQRISKRAVWSAASDQGETILVTVGDDQRLRCWELPELNLRYEKPIDWGVRDVCVAPDGRWIATAPTIADGNTRQEGTIAILDAATGETRLHLQGHENWVLKMATTPDGRRLVSSDENRVVRIWNLQTGEQEQRIAPPGKSPAEHVCLHSKTNTLYLGHRDGWITSWNLQDGTRLASWPAFGDALTGLAVTNDSRILATSRSSPLLRIFGKSVVSPVAEFDLGFGYVNQFQLSKDESTAAIFGQDQHLRLKTFD